MIKRIKVGMASCGIAAGADKVYEYLEENMTDIELVKVGCIGHCYAEPIVEVETEEESVFFANVEPTSEYLEKIKKLKNSSRLEIRKTRREKELNKVTALAGKVDPVSLEEYIAQDGYTSLQNALQMEPEEIIAQIKDSGLRGRGGGGFPTGVKWGFLADSSGEEKILICNADEGDPGAFMDRSLLESVPHQVLEGMLIAAYATGADQIFIYIRAEYPLAVENLSQAIAQIQEQELNEFPDRKVELEIKEGAGAFVCGEETAMINSIEGKRGNPHYRPPYPPDEGFQGHPSLINNVETYANVPLIIEEGGVEYAKTGTKDSTGTKLFALAGDLKYPGLVEVPMGITIEEVVYELGGAKRGSVKAVQVGGPSGGCIPAKHFDTVIDYDSLESLGAIMGSGGLIVIGNNRCMVETARYFLEFTTEESCGKCTFCRVGTKRMLEALERITGGKGSKADIELLEELGEKIKAGSLCGLGQTAPNPVLTTLRYFRDEYQAHVEKKVCPSLACNDLVDIYLNQDKCIECNLCRQNCPVDAISEDFVVDNEVCTKCDTCIEVCPEDAIQRVTRGGESDE